MAHGPSVEANKKVIATPPFPADIHNWCSVIQSTFRIYLCVGVSMCVCTMNFFVFSLSLCSSFTVSIAVKLSSCKKV